METYEVSICMEPEKDNQGGDRFWWCLTKYEKTKGLKRSCSTHRQGYAYTRIEALNEGIKAYEALTSEILRSNEETLAVKSMFFNRDFEGLRMLANDPVKSNKLSFEALLCVVLALAINRKTYNEFDKIKNLLKRLTLLYGGCATIDQKSLSIIIDERLASLANAEKLHKLAQVCSLLAILLLDVNKSPSQLVEFFKEAEKVWRERAVKPPVNTGKELVTRAYDLMELGEKDKAEESIIMALTKGIEGHSIIAAANILKQVGQYNLAEEYYIKAIEIISDEDEDLKGCMQESLRKVREIIALNSPAAATQTDNQFDTLPGVGG